jgi:3-oxoacyl-(acyl-carrier-protein) synthase
VIYLTHYRTAFTTDTELLTDIEYPQRVHWFPETYGRVHTGMVYPPHVLAARVFDSELTKHFREHPVPGRTGFILAGGSQIWAGTKNEADSGRLFYRMKLPKVMTMTNVFAGRIAGQLGITDYVSTDATACASSLKVLMEVKNLMENFGFDRMVVLAMEDPVSNGALEFFGEAHANLLAGDDESTLPSAFDSGNGGFHVGQGAALTVFETEPCVSSVPVAQLLGAYTAAEECTNPIGQREDGQGYQRAVEGALFAAKTQPNAVKLVKTHGTGTKINDQSERAALERTLPNFVATSYKPRIGHTLAASGLLETCLLLDDQKRGIIPKILNRTEADSVFLSEDGVAEKGVFLSLAAGMGNAYAAAAFNTDF